MKKILSLLLATALVIGMIPVFFLSVGATPTETPEEFPALLITEVTANTVNYCEQYPVWKAMMPEIFAAAPEGDAASNYWDVFRYIEIYNAGNTTVNLYDYKLAYDPIGGQTGGTVQFNTLTAGGVPNSIRYGGYDRVILPYGTSLDGYYTFDGSSYTECDASDTAALDGVYYREVSYGEYSVVNPDTATLDPGACAVVWIYGSDDMSAHLTTEQFKAYYEYQFAQGKTGNTYTVDLSDVLVLCTSASDGFNLQQWGECFYGIVPADYTNTADAAREDEWISYAHWTQYEGVTAAALVGVYQTTVGETNVLAANCFVKDEATNTYRPVSVADGTCDAEGKALQVKLTGGEPVAVTQSLIGTYVEKSQYLVYNETLGIYVHPNYDDNTADEKGMAVTGVQYYLAEYEEIVYYTFNLSKSNTTYFHYMANASTANFLYGFDTARPLREGVPYTPTSTDLTPGCLTEVQRASLPGAASVELPGLVITEVAPNPADAQPYKYVEVLNTSAHPINIFDYSFVMQTTTPTSMRNEYFSKIHTIIPAEAGNVMVANPMAVNRAIAPTNPAYADGYLQPGETALIWSYSATAASLRLSIDDFRIFYDLPPEYKVVATDTDPVLSYHADIPTGFSTCGLVKNDRIGFTGEPYVSAPMMNAVEFTNSVRTSAVYGVSFRECECFVLNNPVALTCFNTAITEGYAYQYVWNAPNGVSGKLGIPLRRGMMEMAKYNAPTIFKFSSPVIDESFLASPGALLTAQSVPTAALNAVYMYDAAGTDTTDAPKNEDDKFTYLGVLSDGRHVYLSRAVSYVASEANVKISEAATAVSASAGTTISFKAKVDRSYYKELENRFAGKVGVKIFRTADFGKLSGFTAEELSAAGVVPVATSDNMQKVLMGSVYEFSSAPAAMQSGYFTDSYFAVAYVQFETALGVSTIYSAPSSSLSARQSLASAMMGVSDVRTEEYCYDLGDGTYSKYTAAQRRVFEQICRAD